MVERTAEALRDGEQAAAERHEAAAELEQALIAQKQGEAHEVVEPPEGHENATPGAVGAGPDLDGPPAARDATDGGPGIRDNVELPGDERTFEGDGPHPLDEQ